MGNNAHQWIIDAIPYPADKKHGCRRTGGDEEDIRVEKSKIEHKGLPVQHRGQISETIRDFFPQGQFAGIHVGHGCLLFIDDSIQRRVFFCDEGIYVFLRKKSLNLFSDKIFLYFKGLKYWQKLTGISPHESILVYSGTESQTRTYGRVIEWKSLRALLD